MRCAAAETLAELARAHGWTVQVRYSRGTLDYTHKGAPKPDGGNFNVLVAEPVSGAGVYCARGERRVVAWYVARELPERLTSTGKLSWSLDSAIGRKLIRDGWTPTAFTQATEKGVDKKGRPVTRPAGPTTKAQVEAYLVEHGEALASAEPELVIDLGAKRPSWAAAA